MSMIKFGMDSWPFSVQDGLKRLNRVVENVNQNMFVTMFMDFMRKLICFIMLCGHEPGYICRIKLEFEEMTERELYLV